jgi:hypothetical protein
VRTSYHAIAPLAAHQVASISQYSHDKEADDVHPNGRIGQPPDMLQAAHQSTNHADNHEDKEADNVADIRIRQLSNDLATSENQDGHRHELLQRLGNIDEVARPRAEDPEEGVAKTQYGISGGV